MELVKHHPEFASILAGLGHRNRHTMDKARTLLDWTPRPTSKPPWTAPVPSSPTAPRGARSGEVECGQDRFGEERFLVIEEVADEATE